MRKGRRAAALKDISDMLERAFLCDDPNLAERYAAMAWKASTRHRVRMPYAMRSAFCKKCKGFMPPGSGSRVRLGGRPPALRVTCLRCGHIYRKILKPYGAKRPKSRTPPN